MDELLLNGVKPLIHVMRSIIPAVADCHLLIAAVNSSDTPAR
jgi:hypothetical protein